MQLFFSLLETRRPPQGKGNHEIGCVHGCYAMLSIDGMLKSQRNNEIEGAGDNL